jgi:hypothetical protein
MAAATAEVVGTGTGLLSQMRPAWMPTSASRSGFRKATLPVYVDDMYSTFSVLKVPAQVWITT